MFTQATAQLEPACGPETAPSATTSAALAGSTASGPTSNAPKRLVSSPLSPTTRTRRVERLCSQLEASLLGTSEQALSLMHALAAGEVVIGDDFVRDAERLIGLLDDVDKLADLIREAPPDEVEPDLPWIRRVTGGTMDGRI